MEQITQQAIDEYQFRNNFQNSIKQLFRKLNLVRILNSYFFNSDQSRSEQEQTLINSSTSLIFTNEPTSLSNTPKNSTNFNTPSISSESFNKSKQTLFVENSRQCEPIDHLVTHLQPSNSDLERPQFYLQPNTYNLHDFDQCPICFASYDEITNTPASNNIISNTKGCPHQFCGQCLRHWTLQQMKIKRHLGKCPVCLSGEVEENAITSVLSLSEAELYSEIKKSVIEGYLKVDDQEVTASMIEDLNIHGFTRCPGCGIAIQKEGHLDDLKCRCGYRFCYMCNQSLGKGTFFKLIIHHYFCNGEHPPVFFTF